MRYTTFEQAGTLYLLDTLTGNTWWLESRRWHPVSIGNADDF